MHWSYQYAIHHEKCKNLSQKVLALKDNPKALYDLIDNLIGTVKDNPLPECASDQQLVDRFSKFFFDKIAAIRDNLDSFATFTLPSEKCETKLSAFKEVTMEQVHQAVMSLKTKSCELDPLPTRILKSCLDVLLPILTRIMNMSLCSGTFPKD